MACGHREFRGVPRDNGSALVCALLLSVVVASLGGALLVATTTERRAVAAQRSGEDTLAAAEALAEGVIVELASQEWARVLDGTLTSIWRPTGTTDATPWGESIDLAAATNDAQASTSNIWRLGSDTPQWRLFAAGSLSAVVRDGLSVPPRYVAAWVADDPGDSDGDSAVDSNGRVLVRAEARGPWGERRTVQVLIGRLTDSSESSPGADSPGEPEDASGPVLARFLRHSPAGSVGESDRRIGILGWRFDR